MRTGVLFWSGPTMMLAALSVFVMARSLEQQRGPVILCDADCWVRVPPAAVEPLPSPQCKDCDLKEQRERRRTLPPAPRPTKRVQVAYPNHAEGNADVVLHVDIGADGRVRDVHVVSEEPPGQRFGRAAAAAVRRWEFEPGRAGLYRITVKFRLE